MAQFQEETIDLLNQQIESILGSSHYYLEHGNSVKIDSFYDLVDWQTRTEESFKKKTIQLFFYLLKELENVTGCEFLKTPEKEFLSTKYSNLVAIVYDTLRDNKFEGVNFFHVQEVNIEYKLLQFLLTEIQLNVLQNQPANKHEEIISEQTQIDSMEVDETSSTENDALKLEFRQLLFQLDKFCRVFSIPVPEISTVEEMMEIILQTLETSPMTISTLEKIFSEPAILNEAQQQKLQAIQEMTFQDFELRRKMLLKRFDVTLEVFLESNPSSLPAGKIENGLEPQEQMRRAILAQYQYLQSKPLFFEIEDAINAPISLLLEQSQKITNHSHLVTQRHSSVVKKILIGKVPDRGGRVDQLRPKRLEGFKSGSGKGGGQKMHGKRNASTSSDQSPSSGGSSHNTNSKNNNNDDNNNSSNHNHNTTKGQQKNGGGTTSRVVEVTNPDVSPDSSSGDKRHSKHFHPRKKGKKDHSN